MMGKIKKPSTTALIKVGLLITGFFGIIMAILLPSAVGLIYKTASIAVPGLLIPLLLSFSTKYYIEKNKIITIMILSSGIACLWTLISYLTKKYQISSLNLFVDVEPMIVGIMLSIILAVIFVKRIDNKIHNGN